MPYETIDSVDIAISPAIGKPKRIAYVVLNNEYEIPLSTANTYHNAIFQAMVSGVKSDWFLELGTQTQCHYLHLIRQFSAWAKRHDAFRIDKNRYDCLNDFNIFRVNKEKVKSSRLDTLKFVIARGLNGDHLSRKDVMYLETLLRLTKRTKSKPHESYTLTKWFSIPWLRQILGENSYLQLESPKRLVNSFRVTVAVTLLFLLESRREWRRRLSSKVYSQESYRWYYIYCPKLLSEVGSFAQDGSAADDLTEAILQDIALPILHEPVREIIAQQGHHDLPLKIKFEGKPQFIWRRPTVFSPENQNKYSELEERLFAWLAACEAIQPTDIPKLKSSDYAIEFNSAGRLLMIQSQYYKGRAGDFKQPAILMGSDIWTTALFQYLSDLPSPGKMIRSAANRNSLQPIFPNLGEFEHKNSDISLLYRLWKMPDLQARIITELKRHDASAIFLHAMLALEQGGRSYRSNSFAATKIQVYRDTAPRPLPAYVFSLSHIKTSAVHAGSDQYRDADLINHHSHTSNTERHYYLSDQNKDWVNQCGRITRLVLHDLQNVVFQPSIDRIRRAVSDLQLRTSVVKATGVADAKVTGLTGNSLDALKAINEIVISDTTETALYFIHYINQAQDALPRLLALRPDFVERTLLIKIEWMNQTLRRMKNTRGAQDMYLKLCNVLPPVFDHLFETIE